MTHYRGFYYLDIHAISAYKVDPTRNVIACYVTYFKVHESPVAGSTDAFQKRNFLVHSAVLVLLINREPRSFGESTSDIGFFVVFESCSIF